MYGCILLVGGGFTFPGAAHMLQNYIRNSLPAHCRQFVDRVEVLAKPKVQKMHLLALLMTGNMAGCTCVGRIWIHGWSVGKEPLFSVVWTVQRSCGLLEMSGMTMEFESCENDVRSFGRGNACTCTAHCLNKYMNMTTYQTSPKVDLPLIRDL